MSDLREQLRSGLIESYKHRPAKGSPCALCGATARPLAFHILELSIDEGTHYPKGFVPMSASRGRVRGSFPICNVCAPPCKQCQLPLPTEKVLELGHQLHAHAGSGICQHMHFGLFASALFKRLLGRGRFRKH